MKKIIFALLLTSTTFTFAGEPVDWSGFYGSLLIGRDWAHVTEGATSAIYNNSENEGEIFESRSPYSLGAWNGGIKLGYNKQISNILLGFEIGGNWQNSKGGIKVNFGNDVAPPSVETKIKNFETITPRLGYIFDETTLIYGTAGLAFAQVKRILNDDQGWFDMAYSSKTLKGYEIGFGLEHKLDNKWAIRGNYEYLNFGNNNFTYNTCYEVCPYVPLSLKQNNSIYFSNLSLGVTYSF